jgi:hypothetical protein
VRKRLVGAVVAVALGAMCLVGVPRSGAAGSDPEPHLNPDQQYKFDPGPGWPAGWQEPAVPAEIPQRARNLYHDMQAFENPPPDKLEIRVLSPLPQWTREYPYWWSFDTLLCGTTLYAYYYPHPDTQLIFDVTGDTYSVASGPTGGGCLFTPVTTIEMNHKETPEEKEQRLLDDRRNESIWQAQAGLSDCHGDTHNGAYDDIYVCFNDGEASARFDVPAYLDVAVGRVRVPIRFVSEMMGANVTWDGDTETVTIKFPAVSREVVQPLPLPGYKPIDIWGSGGYGLDYSHFKWTLRTVSQPERTIVLRVGSDVALVDGKEVKIDAPPVVLPPGRTMVPVRFIAEALGAKVYWVGREPIFAQTDGTLNGTNQVHIYTPFWPYFESPDWFLDTRAVKF